LSVEDLTPSAITLIRSTTGEFMRYVSGRAVVRRVFWAVGLVVVMLGTATPARAQSSESRWGVNVSFTPSWKANDGLGSSLQWAPEGLIHEGTELTLGVAKGRTLGGDWGVSYVRKPIKDQTIVETNTASFCPNPTTCQTLTDEFRQDLKDVVVDGVEAHFFIPFATISNRLQLGVNVGGGVGFSSGTVTQTFTTTTTTTTSGQPPVVKTEVSSSDEDAAGDVIGSTVALVKAEFQAAVILAPGLKLKVAAGLNAPSTFAARFGFTYLFGAR
jgi:hypothetical protein